MEVEESDQKKQLNIKRKRVLDKETEEQRRRESLDVRENELQNKFQVEAGRQRVYIKRARKSKRKRGVSKKRARKWGVYRKEGDFL